MIATRGTVTDKELQTDLRWITTQEAKERFGVPPYMVYRWGAKLEKRGQARKLDGRRGYWLVSLDAIRFLQARKGKRGRPPEKEELP